RTEPDEHARGFGSVARGERTTVGGDVEERRRRRRVRAGELAVLPHGTRDQPVASLVQQARERLRVAGGLRGQELLDRVDHAVWTQPAGRWCEGSGKGERGRGEYRGGTKGWARSHRVPRRGNGRGLDDGTEFAVSGPVAVWARAACMLPRPDCAGARSLDPVGPQQHL